MPLMLAAAVTMVLDTQTFSLFLTGKEKTQRTKFHSRFYKYCDGGDAAVAHHSLQAEPPEPAARSQRPLQVQNVERQQRTYRQQQPFNIETTSE